MPSTEYVDREVLKTSLMIRTAEWDEYLDTLLAAAREAIDKHTGQNFLETNTDVIRYFDGNGTKVLAIDEATAITLVRVDINLDNTWSITLVEDVDFTLYPLNTQPKNSMVIRSISKLLNVFPNQPRAVEVTGTWGYSQIPDLVAQAACCTAGRWFKRKDKDYKDITGDGGVNTLDPDVIVMLESFKADSSGRIEILFP